MDRDERQPDPALEGRIAAYGKRLWAGRDKAPRRIADRWVDGFIGRLMANQAFRIQALRFVDVMPSLSGDDDLLRHLREYFGADDLGLAFPLRWGLKQRYLHGPFVAKAVRRAVLMLAGRFIAGATPVEALEKVASLRRGNIGFNLDLLGEAVLSEDEADRYQASYLRLIDETAAVLDHWPPCPLVDAVDGRQGPRLYVSLKATSLCSHIDAVDPSGSVAGITERLRPVLAAARRRGAFVCVDMEQYAFKDIVLQCFKSLLMEPEFRDWADVGIALQAYLRETEHDLDDLIRWAKSRSTPVTVRLVRGAYWDYETVVAGQHGWLVPVFEEKWATDACYERCLDLLLRNHAVVRAGVASHNVRSIALAMALAEQYGVSNDRFEFQMLFGMADDLKHALAAMGYCLRVYMPYGEPIPGMAYLVRRLLENASGQAFMFDAPSRGSDLEALLAPPEPPPAAATRVPEREARGQGMFPPFRNEPPCRFIGAEERDRFARAIEGVRGQLGRRYSLIIDGEEVDTGRYIDSVNPARPDEIVGHVAMAGAEEADRAVAGAQAAFLRWSQTPPEDRASLLLRTAELFRADRAVFAAWEIFEAGKTWQEADANITETVDFLEYYAREAARLYRGRAVDVPGELNFNGYRPCGVGIVIPPWNFPSAILMGMLSAAIVAGNTVILKPSSQTPVIAARLVEVLRRAGLPDGVVQFLPGSGGEVGDHLVAHPGVHFIAFTGSEEVGTRILRLAAEVSPGQRHIKRVVAEMGGKNAIIVDSDADADEVVKGVLHSAFGYQGQKCSACSRLIIVGPRHDALVGRLVDAAGSLEMGDPQRPGVVMGPVIEASARRRILDAIDAGRHEAELVFFRDRSDLGSGYFVGPAVFVGVPRDGLLAQREIFGPVLSVMRAQTLDEAIEIANDSRYALTGGFYSRSPSNIERVKNCLEVGNLYINRGITGALVERQAFGGFKMSGLGYKAGGPDYLLQFMNQTTWSENTLRHGFAPPVARV